MTTGELRIGLAGFGLYMPETFETADQIAERSGLAVEEVLALGLERKCLPAPQDQPVVMAVEAARRALKAAGGMSPEDVDLVLWTGEEYKDYVAQTASIRLQEEVGCRRAWAFDLVGQGVTSILGLRVARDLMIGDPEVRTVLLAGGTRNVDLVDYANPATRFLLSCSASGGAVILRKNHDRNELIEIAFDVDPDMADEVYVPGGGTEIPYSVDNLGSSLMYYQAQRPDRLTGYLASEWTAGLTGVIERVLPGRRPDYLALRHLSRSDRTRVLDALGLSPDQSAALDRWGHHGTNDPILSLDLGLKSGAVRDGSTVVLASAGIGFTYAAAALRWGPVT